MNNTEVVEDLYDAEIKPRFQVNKGVSYPKHTRTIPWNQMKHV
jgi:hypothetical protein